MTVSADDALAWVRGQGIESLDAPDQAALDRVRAILEWAPATAVRLKHLPALLKDVLSGEAKNRHSVGTWFRTSDLESGRDIEALQLEEEWVRIVVGFALDPNRPVGPDLALLYDEALSYALRCVRAEFDVIAVGSYAGKDLCFGSPIDVVFLVKDQTVAAQEQEKLARFLETIESWRVNGAPIEMNLDQTTSLRKEPKLWTYDELGEYELEAMPISERFHLHESRLVSGSPYAHYLVLKAAFADPLTPERFEELMIYKQKIERERVNIKHMYRNLRHGIGGLDDIEWLTHLYELRYPTASEAGSHQGLASRIRTIARAGLLNAVESETLLEALNYIKKTRHRLYLLGWDRDVIPENPDRLDLLADTAALSSGNEFLKRHEYLIDAVRTIYNQGLDRLRV